MDLDIEEHIQTKTKGQQIVLAAYGGGTSGKGTKQKTDEILRIPCPAEIKYGERSKG
jgi:hypothetical protein